MSYLDFKPINCRACGKLIWAGLSAAGFPTKLDIERLNILEEIIKKVSQIRTYEAHRTLVSFEVTPRTGAYLIGTDFKPERVILAEHKCSTFTLFEVEPPDYWNRKINQKSNLEGVPF
jgi:hypothetical protein